MTKEIQWTKTKIRGVNVEAGNGYVLAKLYKGARGWAILRECDLAELVGAMRKDEARAWAHRNFNNDDVRLKTAEELQEIRDAIVYVDPEDVAREEYETAVAEDAAKQFELF